MKTNYLQRLWQNCNRFDEDGETSVHRHSLSLSTFPKLVLKSTFQADFELKLLHVLSLFLKPFIAPELFDLHLNVVRLLI